MYDRVNWQDYEVQYPNRRKVTDRGDGTVDIVSSPGTVFNLGTAQCADTFGAMDDGIMDIHASAQLMLWYFKHRDDEVHDRLDGHDAEFTPEAGTVTLTNTLAYPFNSSGATVAMTQVRKTMNYDLTFEVTAYSGGEVEDVVVYDKQLNGFKLRFTGSAKSVTLKYKIRGGMFV